MIDFEELILPNTEEMTWPEKVKFADKAFMDFNMRWKRLPKLILKRIHYKGVRIFIKNSMKYTKKVFQIKLRI